MMNLINIVLDGLRMFFISIFYKLKYTVIFVVGFNFIFAILYMNFLDRTSLQTVCLASSDSNLCTFLRSFFCYFFHTSAGTFQAGPPLFLSPEVIDRMRESGKSVLKLEIMLFFQSLVGFLILGAMMTQIMRKVTKS